MNGHDMDQTRQVGHDQKRNSLSTRRVIGLGMDKKLVELIVLIDSIVEEMEWKSTEYCSNEMEQNGSGHQRDGKERMRTCLMSCEMDR